MKSTIIRISFICAAAITLSSCESAFVAKTPLDVRRGAELSASELALMQSELRRYAKQANSNASKRTDLLREQALAQAPLDEAQFVALYTGLGKAAHKDLIKLSEEYQANVDVATAAAEAAIDAKINELTQKLNISTEPFTTTQAPLTELAEAESLAAQLAFMRDYIKNVRAQIKAKQDSADSAAGSAEGEAAAETPPADGASGGTPEAAQGG